MTKAQLRAHCAEQERTIATQVEQLHSLVARIQDLERDLSICPDRGREDSHTIALLQEKLNASETMCAILRDTAQRNAQLTRTLDNVAIAAAALAVPTTKA